MKLKYISMRLLSKKYFILFSGLLLVGSISLDPLHHEFLEEQYSQVECQFCNEVVSVIQSEAGDVEVFLPILLEGEIINAFFSNPPKTFNSRAPPKI